MTEQACLAERMRASEAVVIGGSAGVVSALLQVLPSLPAACPLPFLIVVHLSPQGSGLADLFQAKCRVPVKEAEDTEPIVPGTVYLAPPDYHLLVEKDRRLSLSIEEAVNFSRPSIDVLFESAADAYDGDLVAVVLTGANGDGAKGLSAVCAAGGTALVQTPDSAEARAMPEAALAACPGAHVLGLADLSELFAAMR